MDPIILLRLLNVTILKVLPIKYEFVYYKRGLNELYVKRLWTYTHKLLSKLVSSIFIGVFSLFTFRSSILLVECVSLNHFKWLFQGVCSNTLFTLFFPMRKPDSKINQFLNNKV